MQFSATVQSSDYLDPEKSTATKRTIRHLTFSLETTIPQNPFFALYPNIGTELEQELPGELPDYYL